MKVSFICGGESGLKFEPCGGAKARLSLRVLQGSGGEQVEAREKTQYDENKQKRVSCGEEISIY